MRRSRLPRAAPLVRPAPCHTSRSQGPGRSDSPAAGQGLRRADTPSSCAEPRRQVPHVPTAPPGSGNPRSGRWKGERPTSYAGSRDRGTQSFAARAVSRQRERRLRISPLRHLGPAPRGAVPGAETPRAEAEVRSSCSGARAARARLRLCFASVGRAGPAGQRCRAPLSASRPRLGWLRSGFCAVAAALAGSPVAGARGSGPSPRGPAVYVQSAGLAPPFPSWACGSCHLRSP